MIAVGADAHKERHYAVALDQVGQLLAELSFAATAAGYAELQLWAERLVDGRGVVFGRRVLSMRARSTATLEERIAFSVMRDLAGHSRTVGADAKRYEHRLADLIRSLDDTLLEEPGIGPISAAKLLAFDPTRFPSEGAFARSNGTAPIPASSRKTIRYRLNRGGDRQAKTTREALRSLKRHISRELYHRLNAIP